LTNENSTDLLDFKSQDDNNQIEEKKEEEIVIFKGPKSTRGAPKKDEREKNVLEKKFKEEINKSTKEK